MLSEDAKEVLKRTHQEFHPRGGSRPDTGRESPRGAAHPEDGKSPAPGSRPDRGGESPRGGDGKGGRG